MSHVIGLRTSHPAVQALAGPWLDDSRLTTERHLTLEVEVATVPPADPESPIVFRQGAVAIRRGTSDGESILHWDVDLGRAVIARRATSADVIVSEAGLQRPNELLRSFLLTICVLLLRRAGLHHAHGASLRDPRGRGWLIAGASGSGKSTTSAILAQHQALVFVGSGYQRFPSVGVVQAVSKNPWIGPLTLGFGLLFVWFLFFRK